MVETKRRCALIVEDEFLIAEGYRLQLETLGIEVCGIADTAEQAVEMAVEHVPAFILMDVRLRGDADGVDAALRIYERVRSAAVIFVTGSRERATIERIGQDHAAATLFKPVSPFLLERAIAQVMPR